MSLLFCLFCFFFFFFYCGVQRCNIEPLRGCRVILVRFFFNLILEKHCVAFVSDSNLFD